MYYTVGFAHMRPDLWEGREGVPVMVVASNYLSTLGRLRVRPTPPQCRPVIADCGGFYFAAKCVDYPFSPAQYIGWLTAMRPDTAATMDYPCGGALAPDEATILQHQERGLAHTQELLAHHGSWAWLPVLQGRQVRHYVRHAEMHRAAGLVRPYMGIGSLVGRTRIAQITAIVRAVSAVLPGVRFHLFGVKLAIFRQAEQLPACVASADSGAWNGMFGKDRFRWEEAQGRGLRQAQYEVWEALPAYRARVDRALGQPKQGVLFG